MRKPLQTALVAALMYSGAAWPGWAELQSDTYIRFERIGYRGNLYLNRDGTYVIVQTSPAGITSSLAGTWIENGSEGFCLSTVAGARGLCFSSAPAKVGKRGKMVSEDGKVYRVMLSRGR